MTSMTSISNQIFCIDKQTNSYYVVEMPTRMRTDLSESEFFQMKKEAVRNATANPLISLI